jgi:phosphoadenosine phosphosulfate reductase
MTRLLQFDGQTCIEVADPFVRVDDETPVPAEGGVILSLARFQLEGDALIAAGRKVGVVLRADEAVEGLAYDLPRLALVAHEFPKYRDGRSGLEHGPLRVFQFRDQGGGARLHSLGLPVPPRLSGRRRQPGAGLRRKKGLRGKMDAFAAGSPDASPFTPGLSPLETLAEALERFKGRAGLVSSFGAESAVLLHMVATLDPSTPVLFLDTGQLFGQTLDYRKTLARRLGLSDVRDLRPSFADLSLNDPKSDLWKRDTDACCAIRKVAPLDRALEGFDLWVTGRKRFHGGARLALPLVERADGRWKINPLANFSEADLADYAAKHDLPPHPLVEFGYRSIGCWPCTRPVEEGQDARSGRWAGSDKTECGIHVERAEPAFDPDLGDGL